MRWLTTLLWVFAASALQAETLPALYDVTDVATNDTLNVREGPSTSFDVLNKLSYDATAIEVVDLNPEGDWALIINGETSGWVAKRFLRRQAGQDDEGLPDKMYCAGTEPFWSFNIEQDRSATFSEPDRNTDLESLIVVQSANNPERHALFGDGGDRVITSMIGRGQCSDGMSDRIYGLSVDLLVTDSEAVNVYSGCCSVMP